LTPCLSANSDVPFLQSLGYHVKACLQLAAAKEGLLEQVHSQTAGRLKGCVLSADALADVWLQQLQQCVTQSDATLLDEASLGLELIVGVQPFGWCYEHVLHDGFWTLMDTVFALPDPVYLRQLVGLATRCIRRGLVPNVSADEDAALTFLLGSLQAIQAERGDEVGPVLRKSLRLGLIKPVGEGAAPEWHAALETLLA
jgi:hypothetical protein